MYSAVIIEPRVHFGFEIVLDNFLNRLDERWNFIIFCGNSNVAFLINLINLKFTNHKKRITLIILDINNLNTYYYNNILMNKNFYKFIPTEMFLIFQLDTLISDKYYNNIYDFMEYDYVGATWPEMKVGNGGLSLRRKTKMLEIIEKLPPNPDNNEDLFFCHHNLDNYKRPTPEDAMKFSVETVFYDKSFGVHKPYYTIPRDKIDIISEHIPKLKDLAYINHIHIETLTINKNLNIDEVLTNPQLITF